MAVLSTQSFAVTGFSTHLTSREPCVKPGVFYGLRAGSLPACRLAAGRTMVWAQLDSVIDRWLPPAPQAVDQAPTRATVQDAAAFRQAALNAGFKSATVELIEDDVQWESAAQIVTSFMSWVDCASRIEGMDEIRRQAMMDDAVVTLRQDHPGRIVTKGRNHVLLASA